ncbi:LysM peptidoglycan-binding domain-containing protein [Streptomyces massasporeus]|uniref:LysM peptidoglycan-binding domain-containing protein n=1 Tax=Streptomyces massasporeus TaxID=67324 RepID=UPI0033D6A42C
MLGEATGPHEETCTHTVVSGDTLWDIAARNLGDPERWTEIYDANQTVIEAAAREHPAPPVLGTSDHGHWIFPGTSLTIPGANCAPTTTPTTPPTETAPTTPTGGEVDQQACQAAGRPWVPDPGYCGNFGTISVPYHSFTPQELQQLQVAADAVGCLSDLASLLAALAPVLGVAGLEWVETVQTGALAWTTVQHALSGNEEELEWDAIKWKAKAENVRGVSCFRLAIDAS